MKNRPHVSNHGWMRPWRRGQLSSVVPVNAFIAILLGQRLLKMYQNIVDYTMTKYLDQWFVLKKYSSFYEAVSVVNASKYGLQAGIYTNDNRYIQYAFDTIECGGICINTPPSTRIDAQPYGGVKDSGLGREGIRYTMESYTELKVMIMKQT